MKTPQLGFRSTFRILTVLLLMATPVFLPFQTAQAAQITSRKLTLVGNVADGSDADSVFDGGSQPGGLVNHEITFTMAGGSVGSIKFEYCTTAANSTATPTCVAPTGLSTATATWGTETGSGGAIGFTNLVHGSTTGVDSDDANALYVYKASAASTGSNQTVTYRINGVTNPTNANETFFVRISTYGSTDATGTPVDAGVVAASTASPIVVSGTMPESLVFCTGRTIYVIATTTVPNCAAATPGTIGFDKLFSPTDTAVATSQMAASTNAGSGYVINVFGSTLTSGSNTITAMQGASGAPVASTHGIAQFGMNLVANTTAVAAGFAADALNRTADPNSCQTTHTNAGCAAWLASDDYADASNVTPTSSAAGPTRSYLGQALLGYNTPDQFRFESGNSIANSGDNDELPTNTPGSSLGGTDGQIYTVSYIANVPGNLPAGTYSTTLTYICTPTF